ncbi:Mitochondrial arginine transporter bac2, partial [Datura stramonium]|nr:Mitochondrial arginine transporter bac2 [Datura stramonium]
MVNLDFATPDLSHSFHPTIINNIIVRSAYAKKIEGKKKERYLKQREDNEDMDFWPEFLASSWGKEFVAGGFGGIAGIVSGYPLDTIRVRQQSCTPGSAFNILRHVASTEGPLALYRGMAAPLASVTFQ